MTKIGLFHRFMKSLRIFWKQRKQHLARKDSILTCQVRFFNPIRTGTGVSFIRSPGRPSKSPSRINKLFYLVDPMVRRRLNPIPTLFIWALMTQKFKLAEILWLESQTDGLTLALVGSAFCRAISKLNISAVEYEVSGLNPCFLFRRMNILNNCCKTPLRCKKI